MSLTARAEGRVRAARAFVFDALGERWDTACAGDVPTIEQRASFLLATHQPTRAAVDTASSVIGVAAIRADHPVQRCLRDIRAAATHICFSPVAAKRYAKVRLGIEQPTFWV